MRKFAFFTAVCGFAACAVLAQAQQLDLALSGSTLWSSKNTTASVGFVAPPEKGGTYIGGSAQYQWSKRLSFNAEGTARYHQVYNYYQPYRPILYDANAVYTTRFTPKVTGDFMGGVGGETLLFYSATATCYNPAGGCRNYVNRTHFLTHAGVGVRYYLWRNAFLRPELHWYYIPNNFEFHSNNVFRMGASLGYTFGSKSK